MPSGARRDHESRQLVAGGPLFVANEPGPPVHEAWLQVSLPDPIRLEDVAVGINDALVAHGCSRGGG